MQHMLHQLADNGIMASVFPHGVLFRGGAEGIIREYLIKEMNVLDAVIGLPANIFYGTTIPTCIVVLKNAVSKMTISSLSMPVEQITLLRWGTRTNYANMTWS